MSRRTFVQKSLGKTTFILFGNISSSLIGPQLGNNSVCRRVVKFVAKQVTMSHNGIVFICLHFCLTPKKISCKG